MFPGCLEQHCNAEGTQPIFPEYCVPAGNRLVSDTFKRFKKQKVIKKVAEGLQTEHQKTLKFYL